MVSRTNSPLQVLIAEPDRAIAESLDRMVSALGVAEVAATAGHAPAALEAAAKLSPDVAIVDLSLSRDDNLVARVHAASPDTRIIVLAERGSQHASSMVQALAAGAVGAIHKEGSVEDMARALTSSSRKTPVVADEAAGLLLNSYIDALSNKRERDLVTIEVLAAALEVKDLGSERHLRRVTGLAMACMEKIDSRLSRNEEVAYGFMLHDIGKIGIPDAILKKPGPLGTREWEIMRRHPEMGVRIVEPIGFSTAAIDIILGHHERFDGTGYPQGLSGDDIPITARTFAVADAYDAMTSDRPYRAAMSHAGAMDDIRRAAGSLYDPEVIKVFVGLEELPAPV